MIRLHSLIVGILKIEDLGLKPKPKATFPNSGDLALPDNHETTSAIAAGNDEGAPVAEVEVGVFGAEVKRAAKRLPLHSGKVEQGRFAVPC